MEGQYDEHCWIILYFIMKYEIKYNKYLFYFEIIIAKKEKFMNHNLFQIPLFYKTSLSIPFMLLQAL